MSKSILRSIVASAGALLSPCLHGGAFAQATPLIITFEPAPSNPPGPGWPSSGSQYYNFNPCSPAGWSYPIPGATGLDAHSLGWRLIKETATSGNVARATQGLWCRPIWGDMGGSCGVIQIEPRLRITNVPAPCYVVFRVASSGLSNSVKPYWLLDVRAEPSSTSPQPANSPLVGPPIQTLTNLKQDDPIGPGSVPMSRLFARRGIDLTAFSGNVDLEFRVRQNALADPVDFPNPLTACPAAYLDEIEIWPGASSSIPIAPVPLALAETLLGTMPPQLPKSAHAAEIEERQWLLYDLDRWAEDYQNAYFVEPPGSMPPPATSLVPTTPPYDWTNSSHPFVSFFNNRLERVINELNDSGNPEFLPASDEVIIWKLYSSAFVIRTPRFTFAIDVTEGPNPHGREASEDRGIALGISKAGAAELARCLDFSLHTHHHHDHINFHLVDEMIRADKSVFGPMPRPDATPSNPFPVDLQTYYLAGSTNPGPYASSAAAIVDPYPVPANNFLTSKLGENNKFDTAVTIFAGAQALHQVTDDQCNQNCVPLSELSRLYFVTAPPATFTSITSPFLMTVPPTPIAGQPAGQPCIGSTYGAGPAENDPTNYSYILQTDNGISIAHFGDSRWIHWVNVIAANATALAGLDPILAWMQDCRSVAGSPNPQRIDIKLGAGPYSVDNNVWRQVLYNGFKPYVRIHGHEWEMTHSDLSRYSTSQMWNDAGPEEQSLPLVIGEHLRFAKFTDKPHLDASYVPGPGTNSLKLDFATFFPVSATVHYGNSPGTMTNSVSATGRNGQTPPCTDHAAIIPYTTSGQPLYYWIESSNGKATHGAADPWVVTTP